MKNYFLLLFAFTTISVFSQLEFGIKGNALYATSGELTFKNLNNDVSDIIDNKGEGFKGYNVGAFVKIGIGKVLFIMPEAYYTTFKDEYVLPDNTTVVSIKSNRADIPLSLGLNLTKYFEIYGGAMGSYYLPTENQWDDFKENAQSEMTFGYQVGLTVNLLSSIKISLRYEGPFDEKQTSFINDTTNETINFDQRISFLHVGVGLKL